MPVPKAVDQLYKEFTAEYNKNGPNCDELCGRLKLELAKVGNQLLLNSQDAQVLQLSREVYEKAAFLSIKKQDVAGFERNVKQLKIYYRDFEKQIGVHSSNEYKILGLNLLSLLAGDRIGEFHTELELVPKHDSPFIQRPVMLERYLMEGNYAKINQSVAELNSQEHYPVFLDQLQETMRRRIVESLEKSTQSISVSQLQKMLYFKSPLEVKSFVDRLQNEQMSDDQAQVRWLLISGDEKYIIQCDSNITKISAFESISNVIDYATEIERIV